MGTETKFKIYPDVNPYRMCQNPYHIRSNREHWPREKTYNNPSKRSYCKFIVDEYHTLVLFGSGFKSSWGDIRYPVWMTVEIDGNEYEYYGTYYDSTGYCVMKMKAKDWRKLNGLH